MLIAMVARLRTGAALQASAAASLNVDAGSDLAHAIDYLNNDPPQVQVSAQGWSRLRSAAQQQSNAPLMLSSAYGNLFTEENIPRTHRKVAMKSSCAFSARP